METLRARLFLFLSSHLLLHCGDFLAFLRPNLRRSLLLGSRLRNPAFFSFFLSSASCKTSARATPWRNASACAERPPPLIRAVMLNLTGSFPLLMDSRATRRCSLVLK